MRRDGADGGRARRAGARAERGARDGGRGTRAAAAGSACWPEEAGPADAAPGWQLVYEGFDPAEEALREALCTTGNGYLATRGAAEESSADDVHYPGTYLAGGYDRLTSEVAGRTVENEDLVNWPNWLGLRVRPAGGAWLAPETATVLAYRQVLDLRAGVLRRALRLRDAEGRETALASVRLVHMGDPHLGALALEVRAANWAGRLEVESTLDGGVGNHGVRRYRALRGDHLVVDDAGYVDDERIRLRVHTRQSELAMAQVARTRVFAVDAGAGDRPLAPVARERQRTEDGRIVDRLVVEIAADAAVRVEKVVGIHSSRDPAIASPIAAAEAATRDAPDVATLLRTHARAWEQLWSRCDLVLAHDPRTQSILRLHVFHLLQTVSPHSVGLDVGVPARGLHGEAYRGHIFWDELFILPFLNLRMPEISRSVLMYRYRRLGEARRAAAAAGYRGAMYPWQSSSDGREESQVVHLNPRSGRWLPDHSHLQHHIGAAVVYNVWQYYQATEDVEFLSFYGAEVILEVARFWASVARFDPGHERWVIRGVVGPDEYHDAYPDAADPGLDDNAYTNVMAAWVLHRALELLVLLPERRVAELRALLELGDDEIARWDEVGRGLRIPWHDGVISQFEGYERLAEFDWAGYRARYADPARLDRILEAEGDTPNRYKASKQADVLMLFYLFSLGELRETFARLGYDLDDATVHRTVDYYETRTSHGSTLSQVVHAWVLSRIDRARAWRFFARALESDVADVQGGTTPEGIHLGAMAGTVDIVQRGFTGVEVREDVLWLNPHLPESVTALHLRLHYRGSWLLLAVERARLRIDCERGGPRPVQIGVRGRVHRLRPGAYREFALR